MRAWRWNALVSYRRSPLKLANSRGTQPLSADTACIAAGATARLAHQDMGGTSMVGGWEATSPELGGGVGRDAGALDHLEGRPVLDAGAPDRVVEVVPLHGLQRAEAPLRPQQLLRDLLLWSQNTLLRTAAAQ